MKKTLLLVFIHGFKGNDQTFGHNLSFTHHIQSLLSKSLPNLKIKTEIYPTYETRGDLTECVSRFRDWLLNKVIDLEVASGTPSPTIDPSVRVVLIGHSMGGIVAAETAISIATETPVHEIDNDPSGKPTELNSLMFPYIQGILAFDTPFLGISPGVIAHNAESHYTTLSQLSGLTSLWGGSQVNPQAKTQAAQAARALPAPSLAPAPAPAVPEPKKEGGGGSNWGKWALAAAATTAIAATASAAYIHRNQISSTLNWATSHLEFVGCLAKKEDLKKRVNTVLRLKKELGMGFGNLYTRLGNSASSGQSAAGATSYSGMVLGKERTFCVVPQKGGVGIEEKCWREAINDKAGDEVTAHISMFEPKENPGYDKLANDARDMITSWLQNEWYATSSSEETTVKA